MATSKIFILAILPEATGNSVLCYLRGRPDTRDLTGGIPTQLGNLTQLTGGIPTQLGNLRGGSPPDPERGLIVWGPVRT